MMPQYGPGNFLAGGRENFVLDDWVVKVDLFTSSNLFGQHLIIGGWVITGRILQRGKLDITSHPAIPARHVSI